MKKKDYVIIITILIIIGITIRIINWPNTIEEINCDEAITALNAKAISESGKDIYGASYPVYFESWLIGGQSAFATYIIALFIKVFGFNIISIRLPILIFSIISIIIISLIANKICKNNFFSIIAVLLVIINPWSILQSQWMLDCNFFPHIILIAFYLLIEGIQKNKKWIRYLSIIVFSITLYTYGIAIYATPIFLFITVIYLLYIKKIRLREVVLYVLIFFTISTPIILMTIINLFSLKTINIGGITIQNFEYVIRTKDMLLFSPNKLKMLFINIRTLLRIIIFQYDYLDWNAFKYYGTIYLVSIPIIIYGILKLILNKKNIKEEYDKVGLVILGFYLVIGIFVGILINEVNINRINVIWYPLIIFNAIGIYELLKSFKNKKVVLVFIGSLYMLSFISFYIYYFNVGSKIISNSFTWPNGLIEAIRCAEDYNLEEIVLSENVCESDKTDVFIRYATKNEQIEKIAKDEFIKFYKKDEKVNINYSTKNISFSIENPQEYLEKECYILKKDEVQQILNIKDYNENVFGNYCVLIEKNEK